MPAKGSTQARLSVAVQVRRLRQGRQGQQQDQADGFTQVIGIWTPV
jgi:hypothetical protein